MASSRHGPAPALSPGVRKRKLRRVYERRIHGFSILLAGPGLIVAIIFTFQQNWSRDAKWSLAVALVLFFFIFEAVLHDQVIRPLQTLTNVISSLREEDFSFRARGAVQNDALGELATEVNALADTLSAQKTFAVEATELLKRVLEEIDTPLFHVPMANSTGKLRRNPAAALSGGAAGTHCRRHRTHRIFSIRDRPPRSVAQSQCAGWCGAHRSVKRACRTR